MNSHLIIGFGKWAKKNLDYLVNKDYFDQIYIKNRSIYKNYNSNKIIKKKELEIILKKIKSVHICTPIKNHFYYLKKFFFLKKIIIEKPIFNQIEQFKILSKKRKDQYFVVNYIDLFNPLINKIKKHIKDKKFKKIILNYSSQTKFFKPSYDFANEWLDHPLSFVLYIFNKFPKSKVVLDNVIKKKKLISRSIQINYFLKKYEIIIKLNCSKTIQRNIQIIDEDGIHLFDLKKNIIYKNKKNIFKSKTTSFDNLYNSLFNKRYYSFQNTSFHKKIFLEKRKLQKKLLN